MIRSLDCSKAGLGILDQATKFNFDFRADLDYVVLGIRGGEEDKGGMRTTTAKAPF